MIPLTNNKYECFKYKKLTPCPLWTSGSYIKFIILSIIFDSFLLDFTSSLWFVFSNIL